MFNPTPKQIAAEKQLKSQKFRFSNWIPANPDADGNAVGNLGTMVMIRKNSRFSREYREIEPNGSIN